MCLVEVLNQFCMFTDGCVAGSELAVSGDCELCAVGTWRSATSGDFCQNCPYGFTTSSPGATSEAACNVGM